MLKTSSEWYRLDTSVDIVDPDGWDRDSSNGVLYWFKVPITKAEYNRRTSRSTTKSFSKNGHAEPFLWPSTDTRAPPDSEK